MTVYDIWQKAQDDDWQKYLARSDNPLGLFSVPQLTSAVDAGKIINSRCKGLILDIGCGCYPNPSYMQRGNFIGIDPFFGDRLRAFPFSQALSENLPFKSASFDGVTMISVLDHFIDLDKSILEARRVLKQGGLLFVWFMPKENDGHHLRPLRKAEIISTITRLGFQITQETPLQEKAFVWSTIYLIEFKK